MQRILLPLSCAFAGAIVALAATILLETTPPAPEASPAPPPAAIVDEPDFVPVPIPDRTITLDAPRWPLAASDEVHSVVEHKPAESYPDIAARLGNDWVGLQAARAPGDLGDVRSIEPLRAAFATGELAHKRVAAQALAKLGDASALAEFIDIAFQQMTSDPDGALRHEAVRQLAALRDPATLDLLTQALLDGNSAVRREAARAIGRFGGAGERANLEPLLADPVRSVREQAAESIEMIDDPSKRAEMAAFGELRIETVIGEGTSIRLVGFGEDP